MVRKYQILFVPTLDQKFNDDYKLCSRNDNKLLRLWKIRIIQRFEYALHFCYHWYNLMQPKWFDYFLELVHAIFSAVLERMRNDLRSK